MIVTETNIHRLKLECFQKSCRKCHTVSNIPQRYEEVEDDDQVQDRQYIEDEKCFLIESHIRYHNVV